MTEPTIYSEMFQPQPGEGQPDGQPQVTRPKLSTVIESLTGWDEIAVHKVFGKDITELDGLTIMRAAAFVTAKRLPNAPNDKTLYLEVMGLPARAVKELFSEEDNPSGSDEDEDELGKAPETASAPNGQP